MLNGVCKLYCFYLRNFIKEECALYSFNLLQDIGRRHVNESIVNEEYHIRMLNVLITQIDKFKSTFSWHLKL